MQDVEFKQNLKNIYKRKNNIHPINTDKIIYTNGTGLMPYKDPKWFSDVYYYCSKYYHEQKQNDGTLKITFFAGGNGMRHRVMFYVNDLTNLFSLLKERLIDFPAQYEHLESCLHFIEEFSINFKFI